MLGSLEYSEYQQEDDGFGVLPVPIYHSNFDGNGQPIDDYLTQVHNIGRAGAIAYNTRTFVECTAFLNYQSTHSSEVLNEYYKRLCYSATGDNEGTISMLEYIRDNVRNSCDMVMEDAMMAFDYNAHYYKMTGLFSNDYVVPNIESSYSSIVEIKQGYLDTIINYFEYARD